MKKFLDFFTKGIWLKHESEYKNPKVRWLVHHSKILVLTVNGIFKHDMMAQSAALTFYTLISIIPILALAFAVVKGFDLQQHLYDDLYAAFPDYRSLVDAVIRFGDNMIQHAKGGLIAGVGFVVLFWALIRVFGSAEEAFNRIWDVKRSRSITRKFSDYLTIVIIAPILWILSNSFSNYIRTDILGFADQNYIDVIFWVVSLVSLWLLFTLMYILLPNTKVRFRAALTAGVVAGTAFYLVEQFYFWGQGGIMSYNPIYGSFAAIPLFLFWIKMSWQILLFGGELSYAYQNYKSYEQEMRAQDMSYRDRQKIMLGVLVVIDRHFKNNTGITTSEEIAGELDLPVRIVRDILFELEQAGLVMAVNDNEREKVSQYLLCRDIDAMTFGDIINIIETNGGESESILFKKGNELLDSISAAVDDADAGGHKCSQPLSKFL